MHTLEKLLFQFSLCDFDLNGLVNLLRVPALVVGVVLDRGGEEGVDEGSLSESRFTSNLRFISKLIEITHRRRNTDHNGESSSSLRDYLVPLVWKISNSY